MARVNNITEKLEFSGNPCLQIRDKKLEVNADAPTILKIMGIMSEDGNQLEQTGRVYELIFPEVSRKELDAMKLSVKDWMTVVEEAINLILEDDTTEGES